MPDGGKVVAARAELWMSFDEQAPLAVADAVVRPDAPSLVGGAPGGGR